MIVDARGLLCPEPLVLARRALRGLPNGTTLAILATDPLAALDIEALCVRGACDYLGCTVDPAGVQTIQIRARGSS